MTKGCPGKHEVLNGTAAMYGLIKEWKKQGKLDDQEATLAAAHLKQIEQGCREGEE